MSEPVKPRPQPGEPGYAAWYAATHRVLCAHADDDGRPAHWLEPGEKCRAPTGEDDSDGA